MQFAVALTGCQIIWLRMKSVALKVRIKVLLKNYGKATLRNHSQGFQLISIVGKPRKYQKSIALGLHTFLSVTLLEKSESRNSSPQNHRKLKETFTHFIPMSHPLGWDVG